MKLKNLEKYNKILVLGYGVEGKSTLSFLKKHFPNKKYGIADIKYNKNYLNKQKNYDLVIKSPGISKDFVDCKYTTATNIFFANTQGMKIGITGTKGKSTASSLLYNILKYQNKNTYLIGNIGKSMLDIVHKDKKENIYVCELSSYQLDDIKYSPHIGMIINLYSDHTDYHKTINNYHKAKMNIVKYMTEKDYFIYNNKFLKLNNLAKITKANAFSFQGKLPVEVKEINKVLIGRHNIENLKLVLRVCEILQISKENIQKGILTFKSLSHRLENIGQYNDIIFYDDGISTTPESTIEAIKSLPKTHTILLGGLDRGGYDFTNLCEYIDNSKIQNIAFFPNSGKKIYDKLMQISNKKYNILFTDNMKDAVNFCFQYTKKNMIALLSTASPSYSIWKNFEQKGKEFKKEIIRQSQIN